ncbi:hypothetical protein BDV98DRAFT_560229 [Pterulicium gracile]|uniref:Uncharacterized protein n=1 Tax=Pterulicium gracile TaxID=1884261 RepID=A0A5C3QZ37_9AGAR|nr:hypothetical protein BDV98DRAFT_560229 [Pterula gracilis]
MSSLTRTPGCTPSSSEPGCAVHGDQSAQSLRMPIFGHASPQAHDMSPFARRPNVASTTRSFAAE